jgi:hypothetical protein
MGAWGSGLYANDTTCDVRDTYIKLIQDQLSNTDAYQTILNKCNEYIGSDDEPFFWYALADTQWQLGRLNSEVKEKALEWINNDGGLELWEESKTKGAGWKKTLKKLKSKLESPMPKEKNIRKTVEFVRNPWNIGDMYAYQFHTEIAEKRGLFGKYIVFQKLSDEEWYDNWILSVVQIFDCVFDTLPTTRDVAGVRILPIISSDIKELQHKEPPQFYETYFKSFLKAIMIYSKKAHYPKKYLFFIGNQSVSEIDNHYSKGINDNEICWKYTELDWAGNEVDDWLSDFYIQWRGIEY